SSNSLQNGDLAGVISRVLHSAVQHEADIVLLAGNSVLEPRLGQSGDEPDQFVVVLPEDGDGALPCFFGRALEMAEVLRVGESGRLALQAARDDLLPARNVEHQFPYAVGIANWPQG